jgi:hypothetical protein
MGLLEDSRLGPGMQQPLCFEQRAEEDAVESFRGEQEDEKAGARLQGLKPVKNERELRRD